MTAIATPCPEVHAAPTHLVNIHIHGDVIFYKTAWLECRIDNTAWLNAADIVNIVITANSLLPARTSLVAIGLVTYYTKQLAVRASHLHNIVVLIRGYFLVRTDVADAHSLSDGYHIGNLLLIGLPMLQKHAGCTRHSQQIGISCEGILLDRILSSITAFLSIVVLYEGHGILKVGSTLKVIAYEWPVAFVLLAQIGPVAIVDGITNGITELEVESCTRLAGTIYPVLNGV